MPVITNLQNIDINKIETDVMSVLYANIDVKFSQYDLFNKLLEDKYDGQYMVQIHPDFKSKYLIVLRNLMSKYNDIKIYKENEKYIVVCLSDDKNIDLQNLEYYSDVIKKSTNKIVLPLSLDLTNKTETAKQLKTLDLEEQQTLQTNNKININNNDYYNFYQYLWDNNLTEQINWIDPWNGNSIYHELVLSQNTKLISKLIELEQFNFDIKNKNELTPIELAFETDLIDVSKVLTYGLIKQINQTKQKYENEIEKLKSDVKFNISMVEYYSSKEHINFIISNKKLTELLMIKMSKYVEDNNIYIISIIVLIGLIALNFFI